MAADGGGGGGALDGAEEGWRVVGRRFSDNLSDYATTPQPQLLVQNTNITTSTTSTAVPASRTPYGGGGAGGKSRAIRKSRGTGLPYERPPLGRSAAAGPQAAAIRSAASTQVLAQKAQEATGWLGSGFSKIISNGATYLYSSIFRRNLAVPALLGAEVPQPDSDEQVSSPTVDADNNNEDNGQEGGRNYLEPQVVNSSALDVEALLKKTTLSRDEFQRLTELLQSRVVSNGVEKQQPKPVELDTRSSRQVFQPSGSNQSEAQRWRQDLQKSREERENSVRSLTLYENGGPSSATKAVVPESLDAINSSPVEVAIAFMGGRINRLGETSPMDPLNQRDENRMSSGPPLSINTPQTALAKWTPPDFLNEDLLRTPPPSSLQSWGRNRTISRTPYSRPLRLPPSRERVIDGTFGTPSSTRWTPIRTPVTGGREMLKRRSTVLDEGWSSGGPIRRTRQKAVVSLAPSNLSQSRALAFPASPLPGSSMSAILSSMGAKRNEGTPSQTIAAASPTREKNALTKAGSFYVPAQSSETARKILETLEKMTPSPKGKSLGDELAYVRDKPPTPLTEGMLNDQARKSMTSVDYVSSNDPREAGPSGRLAEESPNLGYPGSSVKMSDSSPKVKGKGKGLLPPTENGPGVAAGSLAGQERPSTADGSVKQMSSRPKEPVTVMASESEKGKGFRMNAVFEESGSEDEGRQLKSIASTTPIFTPKLPTAASTGSTLTPSLFGAATSSPTTTAGAGSPSFSASIPSVDTSKPLSSGFTFPTRASLEGPPTPKAMSPASTSPKATTTTPFFQFAQTVEPPATSGATLEANNTVAQAEPQFDGKAEFSFGAPASFGNVAQTISKSQPTFDSSNIFKQSSPPLKASSSVMAPAAFPTFSSSGAMNSSFAPSSSKFGDTFSAPTSSTFKMTSTPSNPGPFGQLFTSNSGSVQNASGTAPSTNLFSGNSGPTTAPLSNMFGGDLKTGISGSSGFGQMNSFGFNNSSSMSGPLMSPDSQAPGSKDGSTPVVDAERPQKRSMSSSFQQDVSKRQSPLATIPNHMFTTFGTSLASSAATPGVPITFAAGSQHSSSTQGLFPAPSFGQAPSSVSQTVSTLPSAGGISPFAFGIPASSAASTSSASSSAGFGNAPSFPAFPGSLFGTASSGSTFGLNPTPAQAPAAAPLTFGSTPTTSSFGAASTSSIFGGFATEAVSQSPPAPLFGSGFPSQSPSTSSAFSFGASSPAFTFGPSTASSSGSAFAFGATGSFPFAAKSGPPSPVFGLSSSVPAFGSTTTNGTMANDVAVNDQSAFSMDDNSMAEEPSQMGGNVSPPQPSIFGAQSSAGPGSFVFGAQAGAAGATGPPFGGFSNPTNSPGFGGAPANPFAAPQPGGSLDFAGGSFALGSGGDRPQRKMFKAKRTNAKRGK